MTLLMTLMTPIHLVIKISALRFLMSTSPTLVCFMVFKLMGCYRLVLCSCDIPVTTLIVYILHTQYLITY